MILVTRVLFSSEKTGKKKAVTLREPVKVSDLEEYRRHIQAENPEFDKISFTYDEENT